MTPKDKAELETYENQKAVDLRKELAPYAAMIPGGMAAFAGAMSGAGASDNDPLGVRPSR